MQERQLPNNHPKNIVLSILVFVAIVTGIFFRFYNLDKKEFWYDETVSADYISGAAFRWTSLISNGRVAEARELLAFQRPNEKHGLSDSINSLAEIDPKHAPLFTCLLYLWTKFVGHSIFCMRLLPALIGLLQIPAMYWLCIELS